MSRTKPIIAALAMALSLALGRLEAGLNAYMLVTGQAQGQILGGVTQAGREGQMLILASGHEVSRPFDAASGLPTGKRQHKPLTITKPIDKSTPLLLQALVTDEVLTNVTLNYWRSVNGGAEQLYFSIQLTNARIVRHTIKQLPTHVPANASVPELEEIELTYDQITWTFTTPNLTTTDTWAAGPR